MVNQIISAARYNNLQSRVANVLGVGSSNSGYNQTVSSSQVPKSETIQATELNQIYADLIKIRAHQTGSEPIALIKQVYAEGTAIQISGAFINAGNSNVVTITTSTAHRLIDGLFVDTINSVLGMIQLNGVSGYAKVLTTTQFELYANYDVNLGAPFANPIGAASWDTYVSGGNFYHTIGEASYLAFESLTSTCETSKFNVDSTQADVAVKASNDRSASELWGGTATPQSVYHEFTCTFADANARRGFFNAGGEIRFSAAITNAVASGENQAKTANWVTMLSNMGTIKFNHTETVSALASGTGSTIGNYDLTNTYQTVYTKSGSAVYTENDYVVKAKSVSDKAIQFQIGFNDSDVGAGGADERVQGDLESVVSEYRATGAYVASTSFTVTLVTGL